MDKFRMSLGKRIKDHRKAMGWSQNRLGKSVGVTRNAVSMWERDKSGPTPERLRDLAIVLKVEFDWLATGRSEHYLSPQGVPLRGSIAAGVWREIVETQDVELTRAPVAPDVRFPAEAQYALRVEGHSMNRIAPDGALIHCVDVMAGRIEVRHDDVVVVERRRADGLVETTVKRVRRNGKVLQLWPESDDPAHKEPITIGVKGAEVVIKALVIHVTTPISRGA